LEPLVNALEIFVLLLTLIMERAHLLIECLSWQVN